MYIVSSQTLKHPSPQQQNSVHIDKNGMIHRENLLGRMWNEKNELCSLVFSENKYDKREYLNDYIKLIEMCARTKKINAHCKGKASEEI